MSKLNLIVADTDVSYLKGVVGYIADKYSGRFKVSSFSDSSSLKDYIGGNNGKADILLVSPELYYEGLGEKGITLVAVLSAGRLPGEYKKCEVINKFQLGDNLVGNILNLFSEKNTDILMQNGEKSAKIIAVYSPTGGSGKTSVAYGCSLKCAQKGQKVFYLNLEDTPSTPLFFESKGKYNLSHIFYYLKAKNKNLSLKIEGTRMEDASSGIHYFIPPVSRLELLDMQPQEYSSLLKQLRQMDYYDVVFVDMPCFLEKRMISVLEESDSVIFLLTPDMVSDVKLAGALEEFDILYNNENIDILSKILFVMNKSNIDNMPDIDCLKAREREISFIIPKIPQLISMQSGRAYMELNSPFGWMLEQIISGCWYRKLGEEPFGEG